MSDTNMAPSDVTPCPRCKARFQSVWERDAHRKACLADPIPSQAERIDKALDMVSALCKPRHTEGSREWIMSIPARPGRDPDLVIADGLAAGCEALDTLTQVEAQRDRAFALLREHQYEMDDGDYRCIGCRAYEGEDHTDCDIDALLANQEPPDGP